MVAMHDDDLELLERWCRGDNAAGSELFQRHFKALYRFFALKVDVAVDDLLQDTFLACVRQRDRFLRQSSFRTYLFAIARRKLYDHWTQAARRPQAVDFEEVSLASLSTSAATRLTRRDERFRLCEALRALPLEQQLLLELHYWEQLDGAELAEVFEVEAPTTRSRLFRARQALRERLIAAPGIPPAEADAIAAGGSDDVLDAWVRSLGPSLQELRNAPGAEQTTEP